MDAEGTDRGTAWIEDQRVQTVVVGPAWGYARALAGLIDESWTRLLRNTRSSAWRGSKSKAVQLLEFRRFEVYGKPSDKILQFMRQLPAESGGSLIVKPEYVAGYLRLKTG